MPPPNARGLVPGPVFTDRAAAAVAREVGARPAPMTNHGTARTSVFQLLGSSENDLTSALGWTLRSSPTLARRRDREPRPGSAFATTQLGLEV